MLGNKMQQSKYLMFLHFHKDWKVKNLKQLKILFWMSSNICVKISLLQDIIEILIYNKFIEETCIKWACIRKRDPATIDVVGHLTDIMLGKS